MRTFRSYFLFCTLITLLSGNAADKSPFHDDILTKNADVSQNDVYPDYRLPTKIKPISYEIILSPNFTDFTFNGITKINVIVAQETKSITLHVGNIKIETVSVVPFRQNELSISYENITEKYTITLPKTVLEDEELLIAFEYNGILSDNMIGFYRSSYVDQNGNIKWLAATQFQTTHARHAFPCFDEPSFKANFLIRIVRDDNYKTISNMPLEKSEKLEPESNRTWDIFKQSSPMSTYLVAFIVSEFSSLPPGESVGNYFKVWSKPLTINQADYALKVGTDALELFESKFGRNLFPKTDMVAVPDFSAGAMENWGLVTFRESRMLYDPIESSIAAQQSVTSVIVHELSHMWFGNSVTPEWWSYLWLSEGFARYFQYFVTAELNPTWNMEQQFVVEQHQSALIADGLESSLSMTRDVSNKSQIAGIGDTITYNKGASIVRMMSLLFGNQVFGDAIKEYIKSNENGLGHPDKLWQAIQKEIENPKIQKGIDKDLIINVKEVMDTWTTKPGYPVISIAINETGQVTITQERFLLRNVDNTPKDITWSIPLTFAQNKKDFETVKIKHLLSEKESTVNLKIDPEGWTIFNVQSSGFYRVNYDTLGWQKIISLLKSKKMEDVHVLNRAGIVDDLLNLGRAGYLSYNIVLEGLLYLQKETNYLPLKAALNGLEYLNKRFSGHTEEHALLKSYILSLLDNMNIQLGYRENEDENEERLNVLLRQEINNWFCKFDDEECVNIFTERFKKWREYDNTRFNPNERPIAYCVAIRHGTPEDWEFLWNEYVSSNYPTDQIVILNALGCNRDTTILEKYLKYAITTYDKNNPIRKQDSTAAFAAVYNSGLLGAEYVLDFVDKYHKDMEKYYGGQSTIATILDGASQRLSTNESVTKFESLIKKHEENFASIKDSLDYSLKIAKYELNWYNDFSTSIIQWLKTYDELRYPLPSNIIPKSYVISLTPYLEDDFHFDGKVTIEADVNQPTDQIILHSSEIKHREVNVKKKSGSNLETLPIKTKRVVKQYDFYEIHLESKQPSRTQLIIEIEYTGHLNATEHRGFYKSSYVNKTGGLRWLAASHLEPVGARKMFPCFDEPALKAIFTIQVNVLAKYQKYYAISNMEEDKVDKSNKEYTSFIFTKSVPMSTYLVAVIVSDFESKSAERDGTKFAVYARPNAIDQTDYALFVMAPLMKFFETTYNQPYPISKLFMAALPDFSSGAMENWGLLTYRESRMLYDENHSPITNEQDIRNVIAHEISHQWFGNLVSPQWWKYLWLNEGFARYFEYHAPARVFDDKTLESQFVVDQVHSAFSADSSKSTHPMSYDVATPREIRSIFDSINYAKAGSVLRMVEKTYGIELFDSALKDYLEKRKNDVATPEHLYASLQQKIKEKELNDEIKDILDTWTTQSGYPVVSVTVKKDSIILQQKQFFLKDDESNSDDTIWHIPITWASIQNKLEYFNTTPKFWLIEKKQNKTIENPSDSLLIFNIQQSGYYRVNYDKEHWTKLINYLKNEDIQTIHETNRAALINDLMNLARAGYIDYKTVINATMYLEREDNYFPWQAFFNNLPYLNNRFVGRDIEGLYKKWLTSLIGPLYARLGFEDRENDDNLTKMLRINTRKWACKLDIADCKFIAARYFQQKQHSGTNIPPNYRDVVYCTAVQMDKTNNYKFLWQEYLKSNVTIDKLVILNSLACSENKDVLEELLRETVKENSQIRYQDSAKVFSNVYDASLIGVEAVMTVIKSDYDNILHLHFNDFTKIGNIISALASRLSTHDLYNQYTKLLNWLGDKEPELKKSFNSYLKTAIYEFEWYEKKVPIIFETLDNLFPSITYRLPKTLAPKLYNVYLTPHMEKGVFEGKVNIYITVEEDTTLIALNSHELNILNIKVLRNDKEMPWLTNTTNIPQQLRIYLANFVHKNEEIIIEIEFSGVLNDDMKGFYRSSYLDSKGVQHWIATTQFEPTHARQAFPCFDEPAFKSKFQINIQRLNHYNSLSNMPLDTSVQNPKDTKYTWDIFHTTIVDMSTYLVAFVVSEYEPAVHPANRLNVWGRSEVAPYGKYAQNIGMGIINALENITDIDYALYKLDLVGIPDFSYGAMENWGLATFREYALFYNEKETTSTYEKYIITIIAHELTHMWFGNLVTCDWWDYIWLNEGFAQYFEWFASEKIRPDYHFMDQFVVYELHPALLKDASISTHAMTNPVQTPEEIAGIFDYVTYGKSASVLRMFFNAFDEKDYISALRDYLKKQEFRTALPTDLWKSFEKYVSIPIENRKANIEEVMNTWTNQPGYPVVNATLNNNILTLTQERFLLNRNTPGDEFYWIPIEVFVPADSFTVSSENKISIEPKLQSASADVFSEQKIQLGPNLQSTFSSVSSERKIQLGPNLQSKFAGVSSEHKVELQPNLQNTFAGVSLGQKVQLGPNLQSTFTGVPYEHKVQLGPNLQSIFADVSSEHKVQLEPKSQNIFDGVSLDRKVWLGPEPKRMFINPINDWYIVNYKQTGFYRVNYDPNSWNALINKLNNKGFEAINVLNRAQIIDDLFNLARANYVDYELVMNATTYLKQETHHLPWRAFFNGLSYVYGRFESPSQQTYMIDLNQYVLDLLTDMYNTVGFTDGDSEKHLDKLNREMILQWACKLNKPDCIERSKNLYATWRKNSIERIPRNARPAVYCTALKQGNTDDWDFLWKQYLKENFATEKKIIITALGCSTNKTVLQDYLRKAIKKYDPANADIRRQDVSAVFTSVYSQSRVGVNVTLDFLMANNDELYNYFGKWSDIADLFVNVASYISDQEQYDKLVHFVEQNITKYPIIVKQKLRSAIAIAETNLLWSKNYSEKIGRWLAQKMPPPEPLSSTRIKSLDIVSTILIALVSYLLTYY
ncbi:uncharacterized protein LOC105829586 [Monomorium pharaonis]|uniref:uncharacterized protein LOC105829586 n=1 Tax=Monomorium pharaonis TaxID=307658 RepID=UPI001746848B|nr:uncharacterized protein LOC105829586 [Monomorium pharaonis]